MYHVSYEDVDDLGECIDLIATLGTGTAYRAALHPEDSWTERDRILADIDDWLRLTSRRMTIPSGAMEHDYLVRPGQIEREESERRRAVEKARSVRDRLNNTTWQEVDSPDG